MDHKSTEVLLVQWIQNEKKKERLLLVDRANNLAIIKNFTSVLKSLLVLYTLGLLKRRSVLLLF